MCSFPFNNGEIFKILEREGQDILKVTEITFVHSCSLTVPF